MDKDTIVSILITVMAGGLVLVTGWWLIDFILNNLFVISAIAVIVAGVLFWFGLHEKSPNKSIK